MASEAAIAVERPLFLRSLRSVLTAHVRAPERKALGPNGRPCTGPTEGILRATPTEAYTTVAIGREANYSHETGILTDPDYTHYPDVIGQSARKRTLAILRAAARADGYAELTHALDLSESAVRRYLKSGLGRTRTHTLAVEHAAALAHNALSRTHPGQALPKPPEALLYLATRDHDFFAVLRCAACNARLEGRQRRWCADCRGRPGMRRSAAPAQ